MHVYCTYSDVAFSSKRTAVTGAHTQKTVPVGDGWHVEVSCWRPARQRYDIDCPEGALLVVGAAHNGNSGAPLGQQCWGPKGVGGLAVGLKGDQRGRVVSLCRALKGRGMSSSSNSTIVTIRHIYSGKAFWEEGIVSHVCHLTLSACPLAPEDLPLSERDLQCRE